MSNATRRRVQSPKGRGTKTYVKFDTAVQRGERYTTRDRRGARLDIRDFN